VIDTASLDVVTTLPVPADLVALGGRPHDVVLDPEAPYAYVTMIGVQGTSDYVVKYSTVEFKEVARQGVGKDAHLSVSPRNHLLYLPCQGSNRVDVIDRRTMTLMAPIAVPGAHGAGMANGRPRFYTTNLPSAGENGLIAINTRTGAVLGSTATPFSTPHNVVVTPGGRKIYVTHSGAANDHVSVYAAENHDAAPRLLRTVATGLNPFGLEYVP
jgi:DNA-binding beta-propeller fold protein YncE